MEFTEGEMFGRKALVDDRGLSYELNSEGHVKAGDISRNLLGKQGQYGVRHLQDFWGDDYPYLGQGMHITGEDEYDLAIPPEEVDTYVERVRAYRATRGIAYEADDRGMTMSRLATPEEREQGRLYLLASGIEIDSL